MVDPSPSLLGRFACYHCGHDQYAHDRFEGCPSCRCAANPVEAGRDPAGRWEDLAIRGPEDPPLHEWQRLDHEHQWTLRQNVTTHGTRMPPYEVCLGCGKAREAEESPPEPRSLIEDIIGAVVESDWLREQKDQAWDEGYQTCLCDFDIAARPEARSPNPYRRQT